ncbi:MAG: hypothetical protein IKE38_03935 [Erysipelotrichaceae bacterium]|nr:hypothetical protein [Erysipelotrichaceae bacterium]
MLYGRNYIIDEFDGLKFRIALKSFYQVNYEQMLKLYAIARDLAKAGKDSRLLDLFCGIGTISLYMSRYCKEVTGVEIVKEAVENAGKMRLLTVSTMRIFILTMPEEIWADI